MSRHGSVIRIEPEDLPEYRRLHAAVWPGVLETLTACNIRNYTIYHRNGWLFSHFDYVGDDLEADWARMEADPITQEWHAVCMPLQRPLDDRAAGEWWAGMEELFHLD
jgi:L-rhamnose mutarotase